MARNQPFDFSEDDDFAVSSSGGSMQDAELSEAGTARLHNLGDDMLAEAGMDHQGSQQAGQQARQARQAARQTQTATQTRATAQQHDTTTSLQNKRGNQPR